MTEEERKRLCAKLRREYCDGELAAGEIERLAALVPNHGGVRYEKDEIVITIPEIMVRVPISDRAGYEIKRK